MAKYQMIKQAGGVFTPASDIDSEALKKLKNGEQYEIEIKRSRNPAFHRKVFAFFNFCFEHWSAENADLKFLDINSQFDTFRKNLTTLAGFYTTTYKIDGGLRIDARSLSYSEMDQEEFEQCYNALINAAINKIFGKNCSQNTIDQLYAFFS